MSYQSVSSDIDSPPGSSAGFTFACNKFDRCNVMQVSKVTLDRNLILDVRTTTNLFSDLLYELRYSLSTITFNRKVPKPVLC